MTADVRELHRLRTFYLGAPGDLRAAFVIDGRGYGDPDRVRADVAAAVAALHHGRITAQFYTEPVDDDEGGKRSGLPSWPEWAATHPSLAPSPADG